MRNKQYEKKMNEDVQKKNESVAQILTEATMITWTSISTAPQLICFDIEHVYDQRMREILQTYIL